MPKNTSMSPLPARGLRREALILLPVSLLLFAALACVTLLLYRAAISRLVAERQTALLRQAVSFADAARGGGGEALAPLARALPPATNVALLEANGAIVWEAGVADPARTPASNLRALGLGEQRVDGPGGELGESIVAMAPAPRTSRAGGASDRRFVRLSSPEPALASELQRLRILAPVVFGGSGAVAILAIAFLYALNRPVQRLLDRARELAPPGAATGELEPRGGDEISFLLAAFDRALLALRESDSDPTGGARRAAEARLTESVSQLGELSAGVAHELRNSLGTLQGYLTLLARRELSEAAREELEEARREGIALGRVVDDFLAFARPGVRDLETVDLAATTRRAIADPSLADCPFTGAGLDRPIRIRGDQGLLARALRNLLLNAAQSHLRSGARPPVEVSIELAAGTATLRIRDHGPGIDPEIASRLFEPFRSTRPDGAGLGLALARRIVLLHGGRLDLVNHPQGGAVAEIHLQFVDSDT